MDGDVIDHHADHIAAQCSTFRNCNGTLPFGGGKQIYAKAVKRPDTSDCNACGGSNGDGRDTRRSDCAADVVPYTNQTGEYPDPGSGIILCIYECI